ncbi:MAG: serine/threonine protein kinase [Kiritimatiellae bacterium]|nr:serine/threonine protein kinase [Kiritimatiellia bacterium]
MSDNEETILNPPCEFGRFIVERELGHGGMGGVYLARDKMLDRQVALKVMLKSLGADPEFLERFKREAQAAARLIHPAIAQIYSYDIADGQPYIAMEMAGGGSLLRLMEVHGKNIDPTRVMRICKQVAEGLSCAADQGLVHGDIKPENILFDATGAAKIVDFGLAGMQDDNSGDEIWGTPYYIAPEKVRKGMTDFRVDMYSLGATIYHALTGSAPFEGTDPDEVVKARFLADAKPPSAIRPGLPADVDRIILKMMAREVIDRYPTWEACIGDINRVLASGVEIDLKAAAQAELTSVESSEENTEESPAAAAPAKKSGSRLVMKGRRKMVMKKRKPVSGEANEDSSSGESADNEAIEGNDSAEPAGIEDSADLEQTEPQGKQPMTIGKMIALGAISVVVLLVVVAGGLVWYIQSSRAAEEQRRIELLNAKATEAREAVQTTLKSSRDFADQVVELRVKSEKQVKDASDAFLAMLDPEVREVCRPVMIPPETKDYTDAIAYSNKVVAKMEEVQAALAKANAPVQPEAPASADTNAPAATPAATNTPAAVAAPAATNAPAAKAPAEAKPAADKGKSAPAKAAPAPKNVEAPAKEVKAEEKKVDYPPQLKAFQQLWTDLWTIRAAEIRVNACMALIVYKASLADQMKVSDVASAEKLAKATADLVEEFEAMKAQKVIEQALRKAGAIKQKTPDLLSITKQQIDRARARAAKLAAEKAAAEAAEAAKKKAAEEYKAKAEAEISKAQEKYEALAARELKRLDWDYAMRQMGDLTNGFEKLTREGNQAVMDQIHKIRCMQMLQQHFIKKGKGFTFQMGKFPRGTKISATSADQITLQRPTPKKRSLKDRPVAPPPEKMNWRKFYFEQAGMLNNLIIGLVQDRSAARVGLKEWSNLMFGAALTMSTLFPDEPTVPARVEELVNKAVEEFDNCQKLAERLFPKVFNKEESSAATSNE